MLTREHAIARVENGRLFPDRLMTREHRQYLHYAERMITVYRNGTGQTRETLHADVERIFRREPNAPSRRIAAFCKLLDDAATFAGDRNAPRLRARVFAMAARFHPLVTSPDRLFEHAEGEVKERIAAEIGRSWAEIEASLFADVIPNHRLVRFDGIGNGRDLLSRYNVAQVQVALYRATSMTVLAREEFKTILRYAKLARLLHTIRRIGDGRYEIRFDGPASLLRGTRRYGVAMARFLPSLLACRQWNMTAAIQTPFHGTTRLELTSDDGLRGHLPPQSTFDSALEESFAAKWGEGRRSGWRLVREGTILHRGQKVFIPDFELHHEDGRRVLLEIVGFWTPEYLEAKRETLALFADEPIMLAVADSIAEVLPLPPNTIRFKSALEPRRVLDRLEEGHASIIGSGRSSRRRGSSASPSASSVKAPRS